MLGWWQIRNWHWQKRGRVRTFAELSENWRGQGPHPDEPEVIRLLSDEALHGWLSRADLAGDSRIGMERELRRREAWSSPSGRSAKIAAWALFVSFLALIVSAVAIWMKISN
jgi:hypothetical protein